MCNTLEASFLPRGLVRGGVLLLAVPDAIAFIDEARKRDMPVLGVDAFIDSERATQLLLDHTLDLSRAAVASDTWSEATRFIEARASHGFVFEVVV